MTHGLLACSLLSLAACGRDSSSAAAGGTSGKPSVAVARTEASKTPATMEEASAVLDLNTFPIMDGVQGGFGHQPTIANLTCRVTSTVKAAFEFQKKHLTERQWKELPGSSVTDEYASGVFSRSGFVVSVMVMPNGPGLVDVAIHNHGNLSLSGIPLPAGIKTVYAGPVSAIYETDAKVADTAKACGDLLMKDGWEAHGSAGDSNYYRKNAIRLNLMVSAAPTGKTMINVESELMSAELPAHPEGKDVRYTDRQRKLTFTTTVDDASLFGFYNSTLLKAGWKSTTEEVIHNDEREEGVYRKGDGIMFVYAMKPRDGVRNVEVTYLTKQDMDAIGEQLKKKMAAEKAKDAAEG